MLDILYTTARAAIKAAGEHAASAAVCGNAALVLVNMSAFDAVEAGGISALDKVIGLGGGVKVACSVLRDHLGDSDVVSKALVLLGNATAKGFHPVVCQHGGQELVRKALKTHPRNQTIQDYANRALALLEESSRATPGNACANSKMRTLQHGVASEMLTFTMGTTKQAVAWTCARAEHTGSQYC